MNSLEEIRKLLLNLSYDSNKRANHDKIKLSGFLIFHFVSSIVNFNSFSTICKETDDRHCENLRLRNIELTKEYTP